MTIPNPAIIRGLLLGDLAPEHEDLLRGGEPHLVKLKGWHAEQSRHARMVPCDI